MTAPPESFTAALARPVLLRLIDTDPEPEADQPTTHPPSSPLATLPALDPTALPDYEPATTTPRPRRRPADRSVAITDAQARSLAAVVVRLVLEVLEGRRPVRQLSAMLHPQILAKLETTLRTDRSPTRATLRLRTVRIYRPRPTAIEASAVVQSGPRCRAVALRLEQTGTRWTCTALHLG